MYLHYLAVAFLVSFLDSLTPASAQTLPNPLICEDSLNNLPPYSSDDVPCLLGCGAPVTVPTGTLLPGSVNITDIPYCQLNCVHKNATPAQSALAADCHDRCSKLNSRTPDNIGWCLYWCVDQLGDLVASTTCVPNQEFGDLETTTIDGVRETLRRTCSSYHCID
jgi:hypothetical protein